MEAVIILCLTKLYMPSRGEILWGIQSKLPIMKKKNP